MKQLTLLDIQIVAGGDRWGDNYGLANGNNGNTIIKIEKSCNFCFQYNN